MFFLYETMSKPRGVRDVLESVKSQLYEYLEEYKEKGEYDAVDKCKDFINFISNVLKKPAATINNADAVRKLARILSAGDNESLSNWIDMNENSDTKKIEVKVIGKDGKAYKSSLYAFKHFIHDAVHNNEQLENIDEEFREWSYTDPKRLPAKLSTSAVKAVNEENEAVKQKNIELSNMLNKCVEDFGRLQGEIEKRKMKLKELKEDREEAQDLVEQLNKQQQDVIKSLKSLQDASREYEGDEGEYEKQQNELLKTINVYDTKISFMEDIVENRDTEITEVENDLDKFVKEHEAAIDEIKHLTDETKQTRSFLISRNEELKQRRLMNERQIKELNENRAYIRNADQKIEKLTASNEQQKRKIEENAEQIAVLEDKEKNLHTLLKQGQNWLRGVVAPKIADEMTKMSDELNMLRIENENLKDNPATFYKPNQQELMQNLFYEGAYKYKEDELKAVLKNNKKYKGLFTDDETRDRFVHDFYPYAEMKLITNKNKLAKQARVIGSNPVLYDNLSNEGRAIIEDALADKIRSDQLNTRKHWIIPKKNTKWERAMEEHDLNPNLSRNGWSMSNHHSLVKYY